MTHGHRVLQRVPLRSLNTFGIDACAPRLVEVADADALPRLLASGLLGDAATPAMVLGGGSNLLFAGDPDRTLLRLCGQRIDIVDDTDPTHVRVRAEAGVEWHALVMWSLAQGLGGLENLALIPGTVGAAPIQNIGAYGVEVGERIVVVEAFNRDDGALARLDHDACAFAYRDSRFKRAPDREIVTAVEFALSRHAQPRLGYAGLGEELAAMGITTPSPADVGEAVIRLRRRKLPDPARIGNAGSFFKNPLVATVQAQALLADHPDLPLYPAGDPGRRKLSAAWLIEACGWKGHRDGDAGVSAGHALVLVNHGDASGLQLLELAVRIRDSVRARFGVALEPEPRIVGAAWPA
ncbi:UDP-N-acetylmuramate dehydrogenase [Luteimonas yindakuii]|uniref:UDP-N-acetylmuramate dehydrogenase n=1 Tax=Luteimonas yindakuii TaxID=2565782 RepID=UPI0010A2C456|nr:UDP-N-acetylmuramate dehydrogenase [Luteimonas yindakuii]QCO67837.1 UDP-N-acetylmuramate dehydrogenase [Luteimonas yindakuii]